MTDKFPDYLLQECRNLVAVHCREICMTDRANGESTSGQQALHEKVFHGSAGYASVLDTMMEGKGAYASMFDRTPIENNREGNEERRNSGYMLELKDIFSCDEASVYIVHERGFVRDAIAKNNDKIIAGRNISDRGLNSIANYKLALKHYEDYCPNGKLPSGKTLEDMVLYVRQKMFVDLKGAKNKKSNARRTNAGTANEVEEKEYVEEDMPSRYMFHGYFTFLLYGPMGLSATTLSCLSKDGSDLPKVGRAAARKKQLEVKAAERSADEGATGMWHRGVPMKDKFACATLAHSEYKEKSKHLRHLLVHNNSSETNCLNALEQTDRMLEKAEARNKTREILYLRKRKERLFDQLDALSNRKAFLEAENDKLVQSNQKSTTQVAAFYDSVGMFGPSPMMLPENVSVANSEITGDDTSALLGQPSQSSSQPSQSSQTRQSPLPSQQDEWDTNSTTASAKSSSNNLMDLCSSQGSQATGVAATGVASNTTTRASIQTQMSDSSDDDDEVLETNNKVSARVRNGHNDRVVNERAMKRRRHLLETGIITADGCVVHHQNAHDYYGANDKHE